MASISSTGTQNTLIELWNSVKNTSADIAESTTASAGSSAPFLSSSSESTSKAINWMIKNRGGMAFLTGLLMVPSQFMGYGPARSLEIINEAIENQHSHGYRIQTFSCSLHSDPINGIICYPQEWKPQDNTRCIVYCNPNGITIPGYFKNTALSYTPRTLLDMYQCPVILFDYRGTGLNQNLTSCGSAKFMPTYTSVVEDGVAALLYAFKNFEQVDVWGSSLGGGVSAAALDIYLNASPMDDNRVKLFNHDSFTKTSRVVLPSWPRIADVLANALGGMLDAATPMKSLINRGIKVTILCHENDPVIPPGARMAEMIDCLNADQVTRIISQRYGHADLSSDMVLNLRNR